jgi:hypothetical protein
MRQFIILISLSLLISTLFFSGCGEDQSDDACVFGIQRDLDKGNFDAVIAALDNNATCNGALTQNNAWLNLAAAYMGKSGLTISNLLGAVVDSNNSDAMGSFMKSFAASASAEGLQNLKNAKTIYGYIDSNCTGSESGQAAEACLYSGLSTLTETIGSLSAIVGKETLELISTTLTTSTDSDSDGTADQLEITACAIENASQAAPGTCSGDPTVASCGTASPNINGTVYSCRLYTLGTNSAYKLIYNSSVLTTDGLTKTDGSSCPTANGTDCFPKPVVVDGNTTTVTSGLLTLINDPNTFDALNNFLPKEDNGTAADVAADLIDSIEGTGGDNTITEAELANFLSTLK